MLTLEGSGTFTAGNVKQFYYMVHPERTLTINIRREDPDCAFDQVVVDAPKDRSPKELIEEITEAVQAVQSSARTAPVDPAHAVKA